MKPHYFHIAMKLFSPAKSEKLVFKLGLAPCRCCLQNINKDLLNRLITIPNISDDLLVKTTRSDLLIVLNEMVITGNIFSSYLSGLFDDRLRLQFIFSEPSSLWIKILTLNENFHLDLTLQ